MDLYEGNRSERRQAFMTAVLLAAVVVVFAAPVVEAAISRVRLAGGSATARIKSSEGKLIHSKAIGPLGILSPTGGSKGAVSVRNYAGGGGVLAAGDCTASTQPAQGPLPNTAEISNGDVVTGIVITGTGVIRMTAQGLGNGTIPLANFVVNAENPNEYIALDNGLTANTPLRFTGIDGTACNFLVLGQGRGDQPFSP